MESNLRQRVIGFEREMEGLANWLADADARTTIFSISGIGGIGKTTLLLEMAHTARLSAARTLWLDGQSSLTTSGAFLASLEMSLATEYGKMREQEVALLSHILSELSLQQTVLFIDNCEHIDRLEGWLLSSFLPQLKSASVLMVCASRNGLPLKWQTNPHWRSRILRFPLQLFQRAEAYAYLADSGLPAELQKDIAERTEGHPLTLALAVDMMQSEQGEGRNVWREIPAILSAEFLREAASPAIYKALTVLSLLPAADEQKLNALLDAPLNAAEYKRLAELSCVRVTQHGVILHHVVARLLRDDFALRTPEAFQLTRNKVFNLLAEQFRSADKQIQMRLAAHALELYREFLPSTHAYANFSLALKPGKQQPFQQEDLLALQSFLQASLRKADWQSELVNPTEYSALLEDIAHHYPEGLFIVRDDEGAPLAFCAGVWLHAASMPLLERYAPGCVEILEEEGTALRQLPPESADTIFVLLSAVHSEHSLYHPEELGALLMQQWLIHMTSGLRGILASADPQLNSLLSILGFRECGKITDSIASDLTLWELDFRQATFDKWVHRIIWQTEAVAAQEPMLQQENEKSLIARIERNEMKQILERLFDRAKLEQLPVMQRLNWNGTQMSQAIQQLLADDTPAHPLTQFEKQLLLESYVRRDRNKNQLAADFHMSRATFYRHTRSAEQHLAYVLNEMIKSKS